MVNSWKSKDSSQVSTLNEKKNFESVCANWFVLPCAWVHHRLEFWVSPLLNAFGFGGAQSVSGCDYKTEKHTLL